MCGVLAVFSKTSVLSKERCDQSLALLAHRGPDFSFSNLYLSGRLYMGQTILSLTGDPKGQLQNYYLSNSGRYSTLFNGQIYNDEELHKKYLRERGYVNKTGTDAEVLTNLHEQLEDKNVFSELRGMYAYIVFDQSKTRLLIARDIIGEKILFCFENSNLLIFCSEIGPILDLHPTISIDRDLLREYFFTRHFLTPKKTVFYGVEVVEPGSLQQFDLLGKQFTILKRRRIADLVDPAELEKNKTRSPDDLLEELDGLFQSNASSLTRRTESVSCVFSGGVDSSLASMYLARKKTVKNFLSLQFPGKDTVSTEIKRFEPYLGRKISARTVSPVVFSSFMEKCYQVVCSPLATHSFVSQAILANWVKELGSRVLIGADGADELHGGYEFYRQLGSLKKHSKKNPSVYSGLIDCPTEFESWDRTNLLRKVTENWNELGRVYECENNPTDRNIQSVLLSDAQVQLESVGIRSADLMSMMYSVEARSFYLSYPILKFSLNLPTKYKVDLNAEDKRFVTKPLLKRLFLRHFPDDLLYPKQGFSGYPNEAGRMCVVPGSEFTQRELNMDSTLKEAGDCISQEFEWKLLNVEIFLQQYSAYL